MKNKFLIILAIVLLTLTTRLIRLDSVPPHLSNDEISIAYDAYSVSKTGRDFHNHYLPVSFESHGTYKAPLAIYLAVPTALVLGNNEYSVRLPSAILGSLTVLVLGLLVYELTRNYFLSLLSSLILATSPWHIYSSRMALESNIALFFVTLGVYLFFFCLRHKKPAVYLLSYVLFAVSLYGYHTEWGFTPLLLALLWVFNLKTVLRSKVSYFGALVFIVLLIPLFIDFLHNLGTNARANTETILHDPYVAGYLSNASLNILQKAQVVAKVIIENYFGYTSPGYIFFNGLGLLPQEDPFQVGLFFSILVAPFAVGLFNLKKYFLQNTKFVYSWVFIAPLVPAMTLGGISNVRNLVSVVPYTLVIAVGCLVIWGHIKNFKYLKLGSLGLVLVTFIYFLAIYYYHFPRENGVNFQYGYKQVAQFLKPRYDQFEKIIIDPRFGDHGIYSGVPVLYIPYYTNLDANALLEGKNTQNGFAFARYEIREIDWGKEVPQKGFAYVVPASNPPTRDLKHLYEVTLPDHKPAFEIYTY